MVRKCQRKRLFEISHYFFYPRPIVLELEKTRQSKLTYVGYSMGTTLSYMLLSTKPEYNEKINLLISLAPVAYFSMPISSNIDFLIRTVLTIGYVKYEILPQSVYGAQFAKENCHNFSFINPCTAFLQNFASDISDLNDTTIQNILIIQLVHPIILSNIIYNFLNQTILFRNMIMDVAAFSNLVKIRSNIISERHQSTMMPSI
ncbi:uncharacterized protein LOC100117520 isoform X2 [Nasonia vitripennis]|uniref:Uncharacterized protein n=1 Tax=Nasonia vitripennis TaxID=7425 RepID=A0A7M7QAB1_NASVI|nr:uncharacterized protein LOC100117520 isoform X2 [Nasonia vitripennis]